MALLRILNENEDILRKKSKRVDVINDRILRLLDDMKETLAASGGVGLAAPQVGVLRRVVIVDTGEGPIELINPEIWVEMLRYMAQVWLLLNLSKYYKTKLKATRRAKAEEDSLRAGLAQPLLIR